MNSGFTISLIDSDEEQLPQSKNENDLNSSNHPKDECESQNPKTKKASSVERADDKKSQDNQTPKEQVWGIKFHVKASCIRLS